MKLSKAPVMITLYVMAVPRHLDGSSSSDVTTSSNTSTQYASSVHTGSFSRISIFS